MASDEKPAYEPAAWEDVSCPFCGRHDRRLYERFGWKLRFTWVECLGCGLIYEAPRPRYDADFIHAAYGDYVSLSAHPALAEEERRRWEAGQKPLVDELLSFDRTRSAFLDVGSNMGAFLAITKPHWKKVMGCEISPRMREFSEREVGVQVFGEPFETLETDQRFSCIHMSHVIEHVPNPREWITRAAHLLADDGVLVVAVPNIHSLTERMKHFLKRIGLRKGEWARASKTPDHLFEPPVGVMKRFLETQGFEVMSYYTYSRSDETSRKPFNRLYRRGLLLGSNARFYARLRPDARARAAAPAGT